MTKKPKQKKTPRVQAPLAEAPEPAASESPPAAGEPQDAPSWRWPLLAIVLVIGILAAYRFGTAPSPHPDEADPTPLGLDPSERGARRDGAPGEAPPIERLRVRVLRAYPHAPDAFTQGLLWHDGHLYESTGLRGRSSVRRVELETGEVQQRREVERPIFAEGLARVGEELFQLSWTAGVLQVWSLDDFEPLRRHEYEGEGWGLCFDGEHLVMSDGSDRLTFRNPQTFQIERSVRVRAEGESIDELNELECVDGAVWANVWMTDRIVRIDPQTGHVTAFVDAAGLLDEEEALDADVLNGIAWIPERGHFVITGKLWPRLYEVEFVPQ